jgi:hypothetical protein
MRFSERRSAPSLSLDVRRIMKALLRALIVSVGIESVGAVLLALADPHEWDTPRSLGFLLHYPAEILLHGRYGMWAVFLLQGLLWFIVFAVGFFLLDRCRKKDDNAA